MDVLSLFAIGVFSVSWLLFERTPREEAVVRIFFGTLMFFGAAIGILGVANRMLAP